MNNEMIDYYSKYLKYKNKYINLQKKYVIDEDNINMIGGAVSYILLDGTSSSGKTSICDYYKEKGYVHIAFDNFWKENSKQIRSTLPNEYAEPELVYKMNTTIMVSEAKKYDKAIFDDVSQLVLDVTKNINDKKIYVIIVYTPLEDLVRNIDERRKKMDPRGLFALNQFIEKYEKTSDKDKEWVSKNMIVNKKKFIEKLKEYLKYEFENESALINFAEDLFKKMEIDDDDDHFVKLRDKFYYDHIINTSGKSKLKVSEELGNLTDSITDSITDSNSS